jgi:hypothetical protein
MYSVNVVVVKWEKAIDQLLDREISKLTIRRMRHGAGSDTEPKLIIGAFAKIDGNKILGASMYSVDGNDLYECFFNTDVDFTVGSICTVTWDHYFQFCPEPDSNSN